MYDFGRDKKKQMGKITERKTNKTALRSVLQLR